MLLLPLLAFAPWVLGSAGLEAQVTYHVATTGSNDNPGTLAAPFLTVQTALRLVEPGDTILVHKGTYEGTVEIWRSGAPGKPITLRSAGDGPVTLRATFPVEPCDKTGPTGMRTLQIREGADYWIIRNLTIVNGITIEGTNFDNLTPYLKDHSLPGRGLYDPQAAKNTLASLGSDGADYIQILNNKILRRGLFGWATRYGLLQGNVIDDIDCGTGGGVWLSRFSDGWVIRSNQISDIAASTTHPMTEGIRITTGSNYNWVDFNVVQRIAGLGRGIAADAAAGWNTFRKNRVRETSIGFSEQFANWGNSWMYNTSEYNRRYGFRVGPTVSTPNSNTPRLVKMRCNQSVNDVIALSIGSATQSTWDSNNLRKVELTAFRSYWPQSGNKWEGSSAAPPSNPSTARFTANC